MTTPVIPAQAGIQFCDLPSTLWPPLLGEEKEGELRDTLRLPAGENLLHLLYSV